MHTKQTSLQHNNKTINISRTNILMNIERIQTLIKNFGGKRIAVVGDVMVDSYVWGETSRISPEAPVPVVHVKKKTQCLGGASNVMRNVVTLGGNVYSYGVIGDDQTGIELRHLLDNYSISHDNLIVDPSRQTIEKMRVMAANQQLLRVDYEDTGEVGDDYRTQLIETLIKEIKAGSVDGVIFEDYAKGLLEVSMIEKVIDIAREHNVAIALDPHPGHPLQAKGLTLMTPNRLEAFGLAGMYCHDPVTPVKDDTALMEVAKKLRETWEPDYLLITLGAQGMALFDKEGTFISIPTQAKEVFDVSGAGDTVIASFTLALLSGATGEEAAIFANHAAGVVVGKVGTVSVDINEVVESFTKEELV